MHAFVMVKLIKIKMQPLIKFLQIAINTEFLLPSLESSPWFPSMACAISANVKKPICWVHLIIRPCLYYALMIPYLDLAGQSIVYVTRKCAYMFVGNSFLKKITQFHFTIWFPILTFICPCLLLSLSEKHICSRLLDFFVE